MAPTDNYSTGGADARITVNSGNNYPLVYTSAQGHTLYAPLNDPSTTFGRALFISSGGMKIQGGTFESQGASPDGIVNGTGTGYLTIDGGEYLNVNGTGAKTFLVIFGGGGTGTLTVQNGTFTVHTLKFGDGSTSTGTGKVYLNGGTLSVGTILDSGSANSYLYLNGGTLQARASTETFFNNLDNVFIQAGGAKIDTQSNTINIPVALQHDSTGPTLDGGLTKTGSSILKLSAANTYTGTTTVSAGVLQITHANALGTTDAGTTVANGARLELAGGITVSGESLTLYGQGTGNVPGLVSVGGGTNTWNGPITMAENDVRISTNSGQTLVISGAIGDGGNGYNLVIRNSGGTTILSGANTYSGATRVFVGSVKIDGGNNRLPTASVLQIGNPSNVDWATFDLNGYNQQVAGLVSEGTTMTMTVTNSSTTASTLTINNSTDRTYSGVISGTLNLVKQGTGQQTLSGSSANTYTGTTEVQAGRLHLNKSSGGVGVVAVSGDLMISGGYVTFGNDEQIADTATVTMSGSSSALNGTGPNVGQRQTQVETIANLIVTGGAFNAGTESSWTITGQGSFTGGVSSTTTFIGNSGAQVSFGSLDITGMNATASGTVGKPNSFTLYGKSLSRRTTLTVGSGGLTLNGSVLNLSRGTGGALGSRLVLDGNVTTTGTSASSIQEDPADGTTGQIGVELSSTADPDSVNRTFNIGGSGADLTISIPISNGAATTAGITKTGAGTLTLSGTNTYTGQTIISAGILRIGSSTALGSTDAGTIVEAGGTLDLNGQNIQGEAITVAGTITNTGAEQQNALRNVTLSGNAIFTGTGRWHIRKDTTQNGVLALGEYTATKTGTNCVSIVDSTVTGSGGIVVNQGTLSLTRSTWNTGTVTVNSGATLWFQNNTTTHSYQMSMVLNGARVLAEGGATTVASPITVSGTNTFQVNDNSLTLTGVISGTGSLTKTGPGTLTLSGSNTYTGQTTISAGILRIGSSTALGSTDAGTIVEAGGTLDLNGQNIQGEAITVAGTITNTGAEQQNALRNVTLSGNAIFTGTGRWHIRKDTTQNGVLALGAYTATKTGTNCVSIVDSTVTGSGGIVVNQGTLSLTRSTWNTGTVTVNSGATLWFENNTTTHSYQMSMVLNGATVLASGAVTTVASPITVSGTNTFQVNNNSLTLTGVISGTGSLTKTGAGTLTLSGDNTYTGTTDVQAGKLALVSSTSNNNIPGSSVIQVGAGATLDVTGLADTVDLILASGQTLQGNGTVSGNVQTPAGAFLGAGTSPGHLTIQGDYTQNDGGTMLVELAGYTQGSTQAVPGQWTTNGYDWVSVSGSAVLDGYVDIALLAGFQPATGDVFNVLTAAGGITDQGLDLVWQSGSLQPGQYWTYQIVSGQSPGEQILQLQVGVPEPATWLLLILGSAALALARGHFCRKRNGRIDSAG